MSRLFEPNGDRYYDHCDDCEPRRKHRGCACGLDGYPGTCPGRDRCPYNDEYDESGEEEAHG
jgi:hypothetical protein